MEDLEEISDTATENDKEQGIIIDDDDDDEPEEGEISDDEITIERVVKPSEVVIYDDLGRTAIFTSPKKNEDNWARGVMEHYTNYCDAQESARRNSCTRKKTSYRDITRKHRRSSKTFSKHPSRHKLKASAEKEKRSKQRSPSSSSDSGESSGSTCSCSCSTASCCSSDVLVLSPPKSRGKENKQVSQVERRQLQSAGVSHSHFQSYFEENYHKREGKVKRSSELGASVSEKDHSSSRKLTRPHSPPHRKEVTRQSPPIYGRMKHSKPSRLSARSVRPPSRNLKTPTKSSNDRSKSRIRGKVLKGKSVKRKESTASSSRKDNHSFSEGKEEVDLTLGDKNSLPPPGSLGEMLLRKTKKGKLKVTNKSGLPTSRDNATKGSTGSLAGKSESVDHPIINVDDDDDDDEGETSKVLKDMITVGLDDEDEDELQLRWIALKSSLKILSDVRKESHVASQIASLEAKDSDTFNSCTVSDSECPIVIGKPCSPTSLEGTLLDCIFKRDAAGEFVEWKENQRGTSPKENAASKTVQDPKDLSDSNQDIIDMEICDSSPEEDNFEDVDDVLKEVGEDIALDDDILSGRTEENANREGQQHNFQIPVEWAYMMPPPPPPDQPDNDINNINSWCYDQNMYLQSMQSTPCNSSEQVAMYDGMHQGNVSWRQNMQHESNVGGSYDCLDDQAKDHEGEVTSVFCPDANTEIESDLTSNLLNLPKLSGGAENLKSGNEEADLDCFSQESSLKDQAAHKYQAFMNAVLQNHTSQGQISSANRERNLLEVNLLKSPSKKLVNQGNNTEKNSQSIKITNNGRTLIKVNTDSKLNMLLADQGKVSRTAAKKRRKKRWKKLAKQKQKAAKEKLLIGQIKATLGDDIQDEFNIKSNSSHPEEEDEDLLRAQLLIDLSKKKMQKEERIKNAKLGAVSTSRAEHIPMKNTTPLLESIGKKLDQYENSSPCSFPSSAESSPKIRPISGYVLSRRSTLQRTTVVKEGSPTHTLKLDSRHLSDIGGYGLDPKHSRYDFTVPYDLNLRKDIPKIKFPPIKPVIINVGETSSEDDEEEEEPEAKAGCSKANDSPGTSSIGVVNKEASFSSNLDSLLKCMRAKTSGDTSRSKSRQEVVASSSSSSSGPTSTPAAVRHLSRTKQEEYHRLKKQLLEKERLQLERQQQLKKATSSKKLKEDEVAADSHINSSQLSLPSQLQDSYVVGERSPSIPETSKNATNDSPAKERIVSLQQKGVIQVQLPNTTVDSNEKSTAVSGEELNHSVSNRSTHVSEDEDDEEALRLMVLKSISKKQPQKTNVEKPEKECHDKAESEDSQGNESKGSVEDNGNGESKSGTELVNTRKRSLETNPSSTRTVKNLKTQETLPSKSDAPLDGIEKGSDKEFGENKVVCKEPVIQGNVPEALKHGSIATGTSFIIKAGSPKVNGPETDKQGPLFVKSNKKTVLSTKKTIDLEKQKLMWNNLKKEYVRKRIHTNEVILQLTSLVQQAAEEEEKRKSTKDRIVKLRSQLTAMEAQFEAQSRNLRNKMEKIRKLQYQMTEDCKDIKMLEVKGEALGKEVKGIDGSLPRIFDFSKSKQTLANSLSALRQQMRDVCNKSKAKLQAATATSSKLQGKGKGAAGVTGIPIGKHKTTIQTFLQDVSSSQASPKLSASPVNAVKRKATSNVGPGQKKLKNKEGMDPKQPQPPHVEVMSKMDRGERILGTKEADDRSSVIAGRKKLDEMNELCPYDLLGRCNDDSCVYQHLGQPQVERLPCVELPSRSKLVKTVQSIGGDKEISKQNISKKDNSPLDDSFQQNPTSNKLKSDCPIPETSQSVDSASLVGVVIEMPCPQKILKRERNSTNFNGGEERETSNFDEGREKNAVTFDEAKAMHPNNAEDPDVKAESSSSIDGKRCMISYEASGRTFQSQQQISGLDDQLNINSDLKDDSLMAANLLQKSGSSVPSCKVFEDSDLNDISCNAASNMESGYVAFDEEVICKIQCGSVLSNDCDNPTTVTDSLYSGKMLSGDGFSLDPLDCNNTKATEVFQRNKPELGEEKNLCDVSHSSVNEENSSDIGRSVENLNCDEVSVRDPLPSRLEEGCGVEDSNSMSEDSTVIFPGVELKIAEDKKLDQESEINESVVETLQVEEEGKLPQRTENTNKVVSDDKGLERILDDNTKVNGGEVLMTSENKSELGEGRSALIGDMGEETELVVVHDKICRTRDDHGCASNVENHCPEVIVANCMETDKSHCNDMDQHTPAVICNGNKDDIQDSKADLPLGDEKALNSEVRLTRNSRGRQTCRRQRRPCTSNSVCRRGRSRNSSSSSSAAGGGISTKGKARGGKKQVSARTRKARGRAPGMRRGSR
ncbi:uncharacterized protein LOC135196678 [Macrobrachium nipponense]|uniref:uncharacterized protein LOC135196678 n=1 Tax=Macrobrachium nipponense TaxID=159736 RepID=UPI0030C870B8